LCSNCLIKHVIEGKIVGRTELTERRDEDASSLKEKRRYCKLKEETTDRAVWRTRIRRGYGLIERQNTELMKK